MPRGRTIVERSFVRASAPHSVFRKAITPASFKRLLSGRLESANPGPELCRMPIRARLQRIYRNLRLCITNGADPGATGKSDAYVLKASISTIVIAHEDRDSMREGCSFRIWQ